MVFFSRTRDLIKKILFCNFDSFSRVENTTLLLVLSVTRHSVRSSEKKLSGEQINYTNLMYLSRDVITIFFSLLFNSWLENSFVASSHYYYEIFTVSIIINISWFRVASDKGVKNIYFKFKFTVLIFPQGYLCNLN